jgi:hypothetical protein
MFENTIDSALRRMGYMSTDMNGHGFRSKANTLLNEQGWNRDAIEPPTRSRRARSGACRVQLRGASA